MNGLFLPLRPPLKSVSFFGLSSGSSPRFSLFCLQDREKSRIPICRYSSKSGFNLFLFAPQISTQSLWNLKRKRRRVIITLLRARLRESPYEVLGVSPSATTDDIKRAYRKMALKYHPDVNKEANAQEKFMRIKHAYNTLLNSEPRWKYDSGNHGSDFSYSGAQRSQSRVSQDEEQFYGFGNFLSDIQIKIEDFFKDLQEEFQNWEASASQGKPKSLWEELAEIGEEFVEFLEKELNISDEEVDPNNKYEGFNRSNSFENSRTDRTESSVQNEAGKGSSIEENLDEIEATLAKLKRELGL